MKYAEDIIKEINNRQPITVPKGCVTGEAYEKWLYEEETEMNKTILYDFLRMSQCDYNTYDTEYDGVVTCCCIDDEPTDAYETFYEKICKKVEVINVGKSHLTCNWSELVTRNLDKFREFSKENWICDFKDDDDEFIYQWICEFQAYFAGMVSEKFYEVLCEFADTLE